MIEIRSDETVSWRKGNSDSIDDWRLSWRQKQVVEAYLAAIFQGGPDLDALRGLLTGDFTFQGPLMTADSADDLIAQIKGMDHAMADLHADIHHVIADGETVAALYDVVTPMGKMPFAEWYWVKGDKIRAIRLHYDPRPMLGR